MTIWIFWLWFVPFGMTMETQIPTIQVYQRPEPEFKTLRECEAAKKQVVQELSALWPDPKANLEKIEVHCIPKQIPGA